MALIEEFEEQGTWLFRYRSFVPLVLFGVFAIAIWRSSGEFLPFDNLYWQGACFLVSMAGLGIRIAVIGIVPAGTSGKNREKQVADTLNTSGIYSHVRHPLYLGNFLMWLGAALYTGIFWVIGVAVILFWLVYERIMFTEEAFLRRKFGQAYLDWSVVTPAFFPRLTGGKQSTMAFSIRNVIKRETEPLLNTILSFAFIDFLKHHFLKEEWQVSFVWQILLGLGIVTYLVVRILRKKTRLLEVVNR